MYYFAILSLLPGIRAFSALNILGQPYTYLLQNDLAISRQHVKSDLSRKGLQRTFHLASAFDDFLPEKTSQQQLNHLPPKQYFATCIPGLASTLANELIALGAKHVETSGTSGVYFSSDPSSDVDIGMKSLLWLRSAHRVMELVASSTSDETREYYEDNPISSKDELYSFIQSELPFQSLFGDGRGGLLTLSVSVILNGAVPKELCHSHYTALTVKNAIVDLIRDVREDGVRPDVDTEDPDVPLVVVLRGTGSDYNSVDISVFRTLHSGGSLHRRGYRALDAQGLIHKAAMKESLASGLLLEAGWDKLIQAAKKDGLPAVLVDPMAGSATLALEAALIAADYAPGLMRMRCHAMNNNGHSNGKWNPHQIPPVVRWKGADKDQWKEMLRQAKERADRGMTWMKEKNDHDPNGANCVIVINELYSEACKLASANIRGAGFANMITVNEGDCIEWDLGGMHDDHDAVSQRTVVPGRTIIASNPPWGLRLNEDIESSWLSLKTFLRQECNGAEAWVLSGSKEATRFLRMKKTRSVVVRTADEDLRWIQYHVFKKKPVT
jgi:putative N6-adenine-specific DNA methylase